LKLFISGKTHRKFARKIDGKKPKLTRRLGLAFNMTYLQLKCRQSMGNKTHALLLLLLLLVLLDV